MIRILSRHALQFDHPTGDADPVMVNYQEIATLPEWVKESAMFKLAEQAGVISVLENAKDSADAENDAEAKVLRAEELAAKEKAEKEKAEKEKAEKEKAAK